VLAADWKLIKYTRDITLVSAKMNSVPSVVSDRKSLDCISSRGGIFHSLRTFERQQYVSISVLSVMSVAVSHTLTVRQRREDGCTVDAECSV